MCVCKSRWSGLKTNFFKKGTHKEKHNLAIFLWCFVCWKSQRGWSAAEATKGRGQTSLTTTKIRGGCATIYNLLCQLHDSGEEERERAWHTEGGLWIPEQRKRPPSFIYLWLKLSVSSRRRNKHKQRTYLKKSAGFFIIQEGFWTFVFRIDI